MRLYSATIKDFYNHVRDNTIADIICDNFKAYFGRGPGYSQYNAFRNSSHYVKNISEKAGLKNTHVCFEYEVPYNTSRIDCLLFGKSGNSKSYVFMMELKQWTNVKELEGEDNFIETFTGGANRRVSHPSAQVAGYHAHLKNFVKIFETDHDIDLFSCAYCHNYIKNENIGLFAPKYKKLIDEFPVYTKTDVATLALKLRNCLDGGKGLEVFNRFTRSPIEPSRKLLENTAKIIAGEKALSLLNEQIVAKNLILARMKAAKSRKEKSVIIVHGGPGTGKSVIAFNLLAELGVQEKGTNIRYACKSKPFREAIHKTVGMTSRHLFVNLDMFAPAISDENSYDIVLIDEAHRIGKKSGHQFTPQEHRTDMPQVEQLVRAAKVSAFFIDDKQVVRGREVGNSKLIRKAAKKFGASCEEIELISQFRCNGSDGYLEWLDSTLGYNDTVRTLTLNDNFDFRVFDSPHKLYSAIIDKESELKIKYPEKNNFARLVAGYCWPWSKTLDEHGDLIKDVVIGDFAMPWETHDKVRPPRGYVRWYEWAFKPEGIKQVGCIYTAQGFEFDYIGVIIGNDLVYDTAAGQLVGNRNANCDLTLRQNADNFTEYVRNIYRVLLSRGMKGCFVYFTDETTKNYFLSRIHNDVIETGLDKIDEAKTASRQSSGLAIVQDVPVNEQFNNYLPVYSLAVAAGGFSESQYVETLGWAKPNMNKTLKKDMFIAKVEGHSMEPSIPDGSYCVFRLDPGGTRDKKIVLVQSRYLDDPETGGRYTVKRYTSEKNLFPDGTWNHKKIILSPDNKTYDDLILEHIPADAFNVIAEFVCVL